MMEDKQLQALELLTGVLMQANGAIPLVFGAVSAIAAIVKGIAGNGPSLVELADLVDKQIAVNDAAGKAEIARLRALIG
jgi:hypothetical protein